MTRPTALLVCVLLLACPSADAAALDVDQLADGVWSHTTQMALDDGTIPVNGLILRSASGSVVVDSGATPRDLDAIVDWAGAHVGPVQAVFVTHFHDDRTGGLDSAKRRGIPSFGHVKTVEQAERNGNSVPTHPLQGYTDLDRWGIDGEIFFPGAGHSSDNVVVWLRESGVLFGGCLIKSGDAKTLGYVGDADLDSWSRTMRRVIDRYRDVQQVLPGHGDLGDRELLIHTLELTENPAGL